MRVGFAGIGRMGQPMARSLLRAGLPVAVWNRTPERCAPLAEAGASVVPDLPALGRESDVVVTMLTDADAARAVLVGGGLLDALAPGSIVLEMSTIGSECARRLAAEAGSRGVALLDAPVSGSVTVAEAGQLFAMVGGDRGAYERATPVLDAMTRGHLHLGASGTGAAMKVAVNTMIAVTNQSIAEALALAGADGVGRELAYDVLAQSVLASPFLLYKRDAFVRPDDAPVAFTAALMRKDLELAAELAAGLGVSTPAADAAARTLDEALACGLGDADIASVLGLLTTTRPPDPKEGDR